MAPGRDERKQEQQNGQGQGGIAYCHRVVSLWDGLRLHRCRVLAESGSQAMSTALAGVLIPAP